jgi:ribosome-associated toxin RatA of RatAB toxin-antitoxin module
MSEVRKSALVGYSAERIFDLIEGAEHYPAFLPWCAAATILERDEQVVSARIAIAYHGIHFHFVTRNLKRRPEFLAVHLESGPFHHFEGEWHLASLAADACRIDFALRYQFHSAVMAKLAGPILDRMANAVVDAFIKRAARVYGAETKRGG